MFDRSNARVFYWLIDMARARNIKPSFFTNEQLADNDPLGRLLFIGLWTLADYNGNLECKPRTIKVQVLPWDDCDIKQLMINLDKSGLIRFYSDSEKLFINIPNFLKHQSPHKNEREKPSEIPEYNTDHLQLIDYSSLTINHDLTGAIRINSTSDRADSLFLNPHSLNPDCLNLISDCGTSDSIESSVPIFPEGVDKTDPPPIEKTKKSEKSSTPNAEACRKTWDQYVLAYHNRYGTDPVRNATVNAQIVQFVKRIGIDESPHVAAFFVHHNNQFYIQKMHTVGTLLADAEKLRTEWATKRQVTNTQARLADKKQGTANVFKELIEEQRTVKNATN